MACPYSRQPEANASIMLSSDSVPATMRAVLIDKFGGPDVLRLHPNTPVPDCHESQLLIQVFTVGVNPVETYVRSGDFPVSDKLPFTPGTDCAGVVVKIGSKVKKFTLGQRVYTVKTVSGSYAEFVVAEEDYTFSLPDNLTFSHGAALGVPYFTAYKALHLIANCQPGQTVLVHGASGGVGTACCQIAKAHGLRVLGTAGSERGMELVKANGAELVFNHKQKGYIAKIQEAVGEKGVDIVCEMFACKNLNHDISLIANRGKILVIGSRSKVSFAPSDLFAREVLIQGVAVFLSSKDEYCQMAACLEAGAEAGWVCPVIGRSYPLSEAATAHIEVMQQTDGTAGKLLLSI